MLLILATLHHWNAATGYMPVASTTYTEVGAAEPEVSDPCPPRTVQLHIPTRHLMNI